MGLEILTRHDAMQKIHDLGIKIDNLFRQAVNESKIADKFYQSNNIPEAINHVKLANKLSEEVKNLSISYAALRALLL